MEFTSHKQILQGIEQRQFFPVYILHGEESYFVDVLTTAIEQNVLSDGEKAFNQMVFYGVDAHPEQIVDFARQFPMMSERKVVILKEAKGMNDCRLNQLSDYISNPAPHTILVLSHPDKAINGNLTLLKSAKISKHVATFLSKPIDEYRINAWIEGYLTSQGLNADSRTIALLGAHLGTDVKKITNEINKLLLNIGENTTITIEHIETYVGISKEYNIFSLIDAISHRNVPQMQVIATNLVANAKREPLVKILVFLTTHIERSIVAQQHLRQESVIKKVIGYYGADECIRTAKNYSARGLRKIYSLLIMTDAKSKGYMGARADEGLLHDVIAKIAIA